MKTQSCDFHSDKCQNCNYFAVGLFLGDSNYTKKKNQHLRWLCPIIYFSAMINVLDYVN